MNLELAKQQILLDQKIGSESSQLLLEGDLLVPDVKPDILHLLRVDAKTTIERTDLVENRVSFSGKMLVEVLYISKDENRPIHYMSGAIAMDDFINMDGVAEGMSADIKTGITNLEFKLVNDRKVNIKAVIETTADVTAALEKEIVSGIYELPESQLIKKPLKINRVVECRDDGFSLKEELAEPSGKPNIREILSCKADLANKEVRAQDGKVSIKGDLIVKTLFVGDMDGNACEYMEHEVPFSGFIDAPNARDGQYADARLEICDFYAQIKPDSDGEDRIVEIEARVAVRVKVYSDECLDMVADAYVTNKKLDLCKDTVKYPKFICRNKNQFPVRETINLPEDAPKMLQVYTVYGTVVVDRIDVADEKVSIEGIINAAILYVDDTEVNPLSAYNTIIPFSQLIDAKGAQAGMNVSVDYAISHTSFSMLSGSEIETRFVLDATAVVTDERDMALTADILVSDAEKEFLDAIPSLAIYIVQPNDTLWKIAKRYNTSIDDLLSLNELESSSKLTPGQKLLIMKKLAE